MNAEDALKQQNTVVDSAEESAEDASNAVRDANNTYNTANFELTNEKASLKKYTGIAEDNKELHHSLSEKHKEAATIDTSSASIPEAVDILDKKAKSLQDLTSPLLEAIAKEKDATAKKHEATEKVDKMTKEVFEDQMQLSNAEFKQKEMDKEKSKAQREEHQLQLKSDAAAKELADDTKAEVAAEGNLTVSEQNKKREEETVAKDKTEQEHVQETVQKSVLAMKNEKQAEKKSEQDLLDAERQVESGVLPTIPQEVMETEPPTPPPTPLGGAPTPAPTEKHVSVLERQMAPAPVGKCVDKWAEDCPRLEEHCTDFKSMKIFCKGTCKHCRSAISLNQLVVAAEGDSGGQGAAGAAGLRVEDISA